MLTLLRGRRSSAGTRRLPTQALVAGALIAVVVVGAAFAVMLVGLERDQAQSRAVTGLRTDLLNAHLQLEELAVEPGPTHAAGVRERLSSAAGHCQALLEQPGLPAAADSLRTAITAACGGLPDLTRLIELRMAAVEAGEDLDEELQARSQAAFFEVRGHLRAADEALQTARLELQTWLWRLAIGTTLLLAALLTSFVVATVRHRRGTDQARRELEHQVRHDPLTGLGNRTLMRERIERALAEGAGQDRPLSVLFLDLDGFKGINDTLGHSAGDELLAAVADRLRRAVRPEDLVVRLGGDEFGVVCDGCDGTEGTAVAERIRAALRPPLVVEEHVVHVRASLGIAVAQDPGCTRADLVREADLAMYVAKARGRDRAEVYEPAMHAEVVTRLDLRTRLADAIEAGQIEVHYQPIVDLSSGTLTRVEALVRWEDPTHGHIPPDTFIPIAEEGGLIGRLGTFVLSTACSQVGRWQVEHPAARTLGVAVNLSAHELSDPGLATRVAGILADSGLAATDLTLEVTESALMDDLDTAKATLIALKAVGLRVAIDDFGTGHSSLARLRECAADELKIDRSFVRDLPRDDLASPIVSAIVAMADSLDLETVAEGIERPEQLGHLIELGCDLGQGYLLAKPLTPTELGALLADPSTAELGMAPMEQRSADPLATGHHLDEDLRRLLEPEDQQLEELRPVLARLADVTGLPTTYLTEIDWDRQVQRIRVAHNPSAVALAEGDAFPWTETVCRQAMTRGPALSSAVPVDYPEATAVRNGPIVTFVGVPVLGPDETMIGTLCAVAPQAQGVPDGTLALMEAFARVLAIPLNG